MGALSPILRSIEGGRVGFWCPGCKQAHVIPVAVEGQSPGRWGWNGSLDRPTFTPSLLMTSGHFVRGQEGKDCWCTFEARTGRKLPDGFGCRICHTFVTDGRIQFLGDCTHELAGQTVDIPAWPQGGAE